MKFIRKNEGLRQSVRFHRGMFYLESPDSDGRTTVPVTQIGKGAFSRAFLTNTGTPSVYLITREETKYPDYSKRMLSDLMEDGETSPYLPKVTAVGCLVSGECVYRMPFYRVPLRKGDSAVAWSEYRLLKSCIEEAWKTLWSQKMRPVRGDYSGEFIRSEVIDCVERAIDNIKDDPRLEYWAAMDQVLRLTELARALTLLSDKTHDYGSNHYLFEFAPRNLGTTDDGQLILLDTVFNRKSISDRIEDKRRQAPLFRGW